MAIVIIVSAMLCSPFIVPILIVNVESGGSDRRIKTINRKNLKQPQ